MRLQDLARRLRDAGQAQHAVVARSLERRALQLRALGRALNAISPLATLDRGYATLRDPVTGRLVRSVSDTRPAAPIVARLADGEIDLRVEVLRPAED